MLHRNIPIILGKKYRGILDELGIVSSTVLGIAMESLTNTYKDFAFLIYDSVTTSEKYFYFEKDGSFNFAAVDDWVTGTPLVKRWGNQLKPAYYAYQNTPANMPTLDTTNQCLIFDGINDSLKINNYSEINNLGQSVSFMHKVNIIALPAVEGYVYGKNNFLEFKTSIRSVGNNRITISANSIVDDDVAITDNIDYTVANTYNGSKITNYKDGIYHSEINLTGNITSSVSVINIGEDSAAGSRLNFKAYNIMFFNKVLSVSEISSINAGI